MRYLFIDSACPEPYSGSTLLSKGLGGTEATVIRIATRLAQDNEVTVLQAPRIGTDTEDKVVFSPLKETALNSDWDAIIVLRDARPLKHLKRKCPNTKIFLWAHDLAGNWLCDEIVDSGATLIAVSNYHATNIVEYMKARGMKIPAIRVIHNPVDDDLKPRDAEIDKNKLIFFSSPHKGLPYALTTFRFLLRRFTDLKLYVSNPGYMQHAATESRGVVNLGSLPHASILDHVSSSLCVFYPNWTFPETFGLVYAESNAVGTPVLAHDFGAAREVLSDNRQLQDCRQLKNLFDTIERWQYDRPKVQMNPEFRTMNVIKKWKALLNE